jgi:2-desacetyl-2-hydroxyethyl bacteriochlorophyllide A dehydrogenase
MRAIAYQGPGAVEMIDAPEPEITSPDEALIQIDISGICGSDLHIYHGNVGVEAGATIGHEYVAHVLEVGDAVTEVAPGDRVVGGFQTACGVCWLCRRGLFHKCDRSRTFGHGKLLGELNGTQAERAVVPYADHTLRKVPERVADEVALFAGDALSTGYHAVTGLVPGQTLVVLGLGPVGLCAVQAGRAAGAAQVIGIDSVAERLALAESFGAIPVHLEEQSPRDEVKRLTGGRGAEHVVEAVGHPKALDMALRLAAKCGRVDVIGVHAAPAEVNLGLAWLRSLDLRFGHANVLGHIDSVLELLADGRLDPEPIVTHRMSLDDAADAYSLYDAREALKIVLSV